MAEDNRSLIEFGQYRQGLQRFEYLMVGVSLALCAYTGLTLHPEKLTFLSVYTIELVSFVLLVLSACAGLNRLKYLLHISRLNGHLLDAIEKRGAVMVAKPNFEGLMVVKYPGRLLTSEEAAEWVRGLNDRIPVLHHMVEAETRRADHLYKWRNRLLTIGFCALVLSRLLTPYLNSP
jgi:hypothetical protein